MAGHLSNGTMGMMWQARWCDHCQNDHACHTGSEEPEWGDGCQLYAEIIRRNCDDLPEIIDEDPEDSRGWSPDYLVCRMFTPCQSCDGDDDDDKPTPFNPGPDHGVLFEVIDETPFTPMAIIPEAPSDAYSR